MPVSTRPLARWLRRAVRGLARDRRFTLFTVATLGLGLGATVAAYGVLRAVLLDPLPYPESGRLVMIWSNWPARGVRRMSNAGGDFREYRRRTTTLQEVAAVGSVIQNLTGGTRPEQVTIGWVSRNFFSVMRVRPVLGRDFRPGEPPSSLLLGYGLWREAFGGDPRIVGRTVQLEGRPCVIVGVMPPGFRLYLAPDAGIATRIDAWRPPDEVGAPGRWVSPDVQDSQLRLIGRLRAGATLRQARAEFARIAKSLRERYPDHAAVAFDLSVEPLHREVTGRVGPLVLLVQLSALLVLLLACANASSLQFARGLRRDREMRTRRALGAGSREILGLFLAEGAVVGLAGGVLGLALAEAVLTGVRSLHTELIPRLGQARIDPATAAVAVGVALVAGLFAASLPGIRASRIGLTEGLSTRGATRTPVRRRLVIAEVALSTLLVAGAALLFRSAWSLQRTDPGFDVGDVLTFGVDLPGTRYEAPAGTARFLERFERELSARPGVRAVGSTWPLPFEGQLWAGNYRTSATPAGAEAPFADFRLASPGLADALGLRLTEGRPLRSSDTLAVLVSQELARKNWPGRSAVGQRLQLAGDPRPLRVVGVVSDVRHPALRTYASQTIYLPLAHSSWTDWEIFVAVRSSRDPLELMPVVRRTLHDLDPELPIGKVRTLSAYLGDRLAPNRLSGLTTLGFAAAGLLLAMVGLFGVLSYHVQGRRHEMAVRMALGAGSRRVRRLVVRSGLRIIAAGILSGLVLARLGAGFLSSLVPGIEASDPPAYLVAAVVTAGVGLAAVWLPALRAARTDPARVLREL